MTNQQMITWIDSASYEDMLRHQRFAAAGDPYFRNDNPEVADHWDKQFNLKRAATGDNGVSASKRLGW